MRLKIEIGVAIALSAIFFFVGRWSNHPVSQGTQQQITHAVTQQAWTDVWNMFGLNAPAIPKPKTITKIEKEYVPVTKCFNLKGKVVDCTAPMESENGQTVIPICPNCPPTIRRMTTHAVGADLGAGWNGGQTFYAAGLDYAPFQFNFGHAQLQPVVLRAEMNALPTGRTSGAVLVFVRFQAWKP